MGKRAISDQGDSLELLLDTITNAFGGIVFLAIMVVVLLKTTSAKETSVVPEQLATLKDQLEELRSEREDLERLATADQLLRRIADPRLREMLTQLREAKRRRARLKSEVQLIEDESKSRAAEVSEFQESGARIDRELAAESSRITDLNEALEQERASRKVRARYPEERSTIKQTVNFTVRYGRLYVDLTPIGEPNLEDFAVLDKAGEYLSVTPKPYKGRPIPRSGPLPGSITELLDDSPPQSHYVTIAIWDDSFEEFQVLRDHLVDSGYDYRLIVTTDGDSVAYGTVRDPKVQ